MNRINKLNIHLFPLATLLIIANNAQASIDINNVVLDKLGAGVCRTGYQALSHTDAQANRTRLLFKMSPWQITGLADGWVIMGGSYNGEIKKASSAETFCHPDNTPFDLVSLPAFEQRVNVKRFDIRNGEIDTTKSTDLGKFEQGQLSDGVYLVDKGHGWIRSEEDFIRQAYADRGNMVTLGLSKNTSSSHSVDVAGGIGFKTKVFEAMVKQAYGHTWENERQVISEFAFNAPMDQNLYGRVYSSHQRFDTIEVRNGRVVQQTSSYSPTGLVGRQLVYPVGGSFNDRDLLVHSSIRATDSSTRTSNGRNLPSATALTKAPAKERVYKLIDENGQTSSRVATNLSSEAFDLEPTKLKSILKLSDDGQNIEYKVATDSLEQALAKAKTGRAHNPYFGFEDGLYVIDQGSHWIMGDDASVIHTFVGAENSLVTYTEQVTATYRHHTNSSLKGALSLGVVQSMLEVGYGNSWGDSFSQYLTTTVMTSADKSSFTKIYSIHDRVDTIEIKDGEIVAQTSTYMPNGFMAEEQEYDTAQGYDQTSNYLYESKTLSNAPMPDGSGYIPMGNKSLIFTRKTLYSTLSVSSGLWKIDPGQPYDIAIRFTPSVDGLWDIGYHNHVKASAPFVLPIYTKGWYNGYELWELDPNNYNMGKKILTKTLPLTTHTASSFNSNSDRYGFDFTYGLRNGFAARNTPLEQGKYYALILRGFYHGQIANQEVDTIVGGRFNGEIPNHQFTSVTFRTNGGSAIPMMKVVDERTLFDIPVTTRVGYTFDGWYLDSGFENRFYPGVTTISDPLKRIELFAKWSERS